MLPNARVSPPPAAAAASPGRDDSDWIRPGLQHLPQRDRLSEASGCTGPCRQANYLPPDYLLPDLRVFVKKATTA